MNIKQSWKNLTETADIIGVYNLEPGPPYRYMYHSAPAF